MRAIGGNLALALGMVGALSIIRFRTPIKDPKDITFLFWSMTAGIVNGIRFYKLSIISSIIIGLVLVILSKKIVVHKPYILILKDNKINLKRLNSVLKSNCKKFDVRNTSIDEAGSAERTVEVVIKESHSWNSELFPLNESLSLSIEKPTNVESIFWIEIIASIVAKSIGLISMILPSGVIKSKQ